MLERGARVVAFDRDPDAIARGSVLRAQYPERLQLIAARFGEIGRFVNEPLMGAVFDLGVSSFQFDEAERGFSFQADADLDMRMEKEGLSAADAASGPSARCCAARRTARSRKIGSTEPSAAT